MAQHVTAHHLSRQACLYVRQSTLQHVLENTESTARQYALRERALALGWNEEHIVVIDQDLGHSGASTTDRLGFQCLVAEVGISRETFSLYRGRERVSNFQWRQPQEEDEVPPSPFFLLLIGVTI